ncbi:MAG: GlsB/YeaQ/YmgE family stress response membrane protein [Actinomycetota bacterium]
MLILAIIIGGMFIGWIAQLILGRRTRQVDWAMALVAGIVGSFVGGLLFSLIAGDGLALKPSGVIGSLVGALVVTVVWQAVDKNRRAKQRA